MTVSELIEILKTIENPREAKILFRDSAAGNREIEGVENVMDMYYVIHGKTTKRRKTGR